MKTRTKDEKCDVFRARLRDRCPEVLGLSILMLRLYSRCIVTDSVLYHLKSLISPRTIGTTGKLYQNNMVPYDRATHTYWSQMGGFALTGPLLGTSLVRGQSILTKWSTWKRLHPNTKVLNRPLDSTKNYLEDRYAGYRKNDRLLYDSCFASHRTESPYRNKDTKETTLVVFTDRGNTHLFPVSEVTLVQNIEDLDDEYFVLVWDKTNTFAVAYNRIVNGTRLSFSDAGNIGTGVKLPMLKDRPTGSVWNASGTCISGPLIGTQLRRLTSFTTYWSAATSFFPKSQIWSNSTTLQYFPASCPRPSTNSACSVPCSSIISAGPAQDSIKSIDAPRFMTPAEFEAIVRVPRKVVTAYSLILSFFVLFAGSLLSYNLYQKWFAKPATPTTSAPLTTGNGPTLNGTTPPANSTAAQVPGGAKKDNADDSHMVPLVLKEDDEEEPALPPELAVEIPKFATPAKEQPPRRRKKSKKHGRSMSLVGDDANMVQMDSLAVPLSARGPTPTRKFSSGGFPVPRLSMQPWNGLQHGHAAPEGGTKLPRNRSDGSLVQLESSSSYVSATSSPRYGTIPETDSDEFRTPHYATTIASPIQTKRPASALASPLLHRSSDDTPRATPRSVFEAALENSKEYSTSVDSEMHDNYQDSLTSVHSDGDYIPENIMSPTALARIQGKMKKSPSVLTEQVFQPLSTISEAHSSSEPTSTADDTTIPLDY